MYLFVVFSQMFSRFIEQRSFVTAQDSLLAFFDNCLERVSLSTFLYFQYLAFSNSLPIGRTFSFGVHGRLNLENKSAFFQISLA